MAQQILKLRRSSIPGKVPSTSSLDYGEIALNTYDGIAYMKRSGSNGDEIIAIGVGTSGSFTGSFFGTSSWAYNAISAAYAATASSADNFTVRGTLTAQTIVVQVITSSQELITGSLIVNGPLTVNGGITGSLQGTSSWANNAVQAINAATASNILGGTATYIPFFKTNTTLGNSTMYQISNSFSTTSIAINETNITSANPEALYVFQTHPTSINVLTGKGNLNNYLQNNIQNTNQGVSASSDVVATANNGNEDTNYIDMGINSQNYSAGFIGEANDAYLYSIANNLHIGNANDNGTHVGFFVGGTDVEAYNKLQLSPNNQHKMSGSLDISGSLTINNGITGSLFGTASWAINALTASYAANVPATASYALQALSASFASTASYAANVPATASYALQALSASNALTASYALNAQGSGFPYTGSAIITGSLIVTGSVNASLGFTGSLFGTASWAVSASQALTASYVLNAVSASFATSASRAVTASLATTASYVLNAVSASFATTASYVLNAVSASFATTSSYVLNAISASFASTASSVNQLNQAVVISGSLTVTGSSGTTLLVSNADTLTFTGSIFTSGSIVSTGSLSITSITSSLFGTASWANNAISASYALSASQAQNAVTASYILNAVSASFAATASSADNFTVRNTLTAQTIVVQTITSSVDFVTGSTRFGTLLSNTHQFTGSVSITGSLNVVGAGITSSLFGTASWANNAISSSYAVSASQAQNAVTASYALTASYASNVPATSSYALQALSASYANNAVTASYVLNTVSASYASTSSLPLEGIVTASVAGSTITFTKGNSSTFNVTIATATAETASYVTSSNVDGPYGKNSILSASYAVTASYTVSASYATSASQAYNATTASYVLNAISASYATSASYAVSASQAQNATTASYTLNAVSASYAQTASYATNITISGSITGVDYINFDTTASFAAAVGRLGYDNGEGTLTLGLQGGNVTLKIGNDLYQYVYNNTTSSLTLGQVVYISGSQGNRIAVKLASATAEQGSANTLGFVAETIAAGAEGWVMTEGTLRKLNTTGLIGGQLIYLDVIPGAYTQTPPVAPAHGVRLGYAERISATVGSIYVKIDNGYELGELHNVVDSTTTSSFGDLLVISGSVWINSKQLTGSYGLTGSLSATSFTGSLFGTSSWANNVISASYVSNAGLLNGTSSAVFATTGSNNFIGIENITGSLNVSGSQSFIGTSISVGNQIVTGSLITSGSNTLIGNTSLTGSVNISGSTTQVGNNNLLGSTTLSGSVVVSGSLNASANLTLQGHLRLDPGQDPGNNNFTASYLFTSASNTNTGYDLYYRQDGNLIKFKWLEGGLSSGILYGGTISYSGSVIYVKKGTGIINNMNATTSSEINPILTYVSWNDYTSSAQYITSSQITYLYVNPSGSIVQQTSYFDQTQYEQALPLGLVVHPNYTTITSQESSVQTTYDSDTQQNDFIRAFGPIKVNGFTPSGQTGSLRINIGSGTAFTLGGFYSQNQNSPSHYTATAATTASLARAYRTGSGVYLDSNNNAYYTVIDPSKYDNGNGLSNVAGTNATIQRIFYNPVDKRAVVYYGQNTYSSLANALTALPSDSFTEGEFTAKALLFVGYIIVQGNASDLSNTGQALFIQAGVFRNTAGGSSGGGAIAQSLDDLSDVTITTPTNGQALIYQGGVWVNGTPLNATSASFATSASQAQNAVTASYIINAVSASYTLSASNAQTASYVLNAISSSFATSASYALSASQAQNAVSASYVLNAISASFATSASYALSASQAQNTVTASYILNAVSASYAATASSADNFLVRSTLTAQTLIVQTITSSTDFVTGSSRFGTLFSNTHQFTGSVSITGSLNVAGAGITGSLFGTASWASNATTASYILNAVSASFASTASNVLGGATNYIPLWNGATTLSSSVIYQSSGNVLIGTTTDNGYKLSVQGGDVTIQSGRTLDWGFGNMRIINSTYDMVFQTYNGASTAEAMRIKGSGNVGIGTSAPSAKLHVSGSNTDSLLLLASPGATSALFVSGSGNVGIGTTSPAAFANYTTTTIDGTLGSVIQFRRATVDGLQIAIDANKTQFLEQRALRMAFGTNNTERMNILANGNVRIAANATDSGELFQVDGTARVTQDAYFATTSGGISIGSTSTGGAKLNIVNGDFQMSPTYKLTLASTTGQIYLRATSGTGDLQMFTNFTERMRITSAGDVGIGTTSPNARLDVSGSTIISGSFTVAPSNAIELQVTSTGTKIGNVITDTHTVTGSLGVSGSVTATSFTGSLFGTSSWASNAVSASFASTASNVLGGATSYIPLWNEATTLSSSVIYQSGSNIGIGTTTPAEKLRVNGTFSSNALWTDNTTISYWGNYPTPYGGFTWDTGYATIYAIAGNILRLGSNGASPDMTIDLSGNVGINTTLPTARLHVSGSSADSLLLLSSPGVTNALFVSGSGNVGIGTTTPGDALQITKSNPYIIMTGDDASYTNAGIQMIANGASNQRALGIFMFQSVAGHEWFMGQPYAGADSFVINRRVTSTPSSQSNPKGIGASTGTVFIVTSSGSVGIGTTNPQGKLHVNGGDVFFGDETNVATNIRLRRNGATVGSIGTYNSQLELCGGSSIGASHMVITSTGNVGIGINAPTAKLHVSGSTTTNLLVGTNDLFVSASGNIGIGETNPTSKLVIKDLSTSVFQAINAGVGSTAGISFQNNSVEQLIVRSRGDISRSTIYSQVWDFELGTNADKNLLLYTNGQERVRINNGGNVGIGTTTPNAKLDVNGNAIVTGSLTVTGTITAQTLVVQTITSSIDFVTGSSRFGTLQSNTHQFTGSVSITGSLNVTGAGITGSLFGTASWASNAITASNALTASFVQNAVSSSFATSTAAVAGTTNYISKFTSNTAIGNSQIFDDGNSVGIGTASPTAKLEISNTSANILYLYSTSTTGTTNNSSFRIGSYDGTQVSVGTYLTELASSWNSSNFAGGNFPNSSVLLGSKANGLGIGASSATGNIRFFTGGETGGNERMRITSGGNIGIGTTTPNAKLDVSGSAIITGSLTVTQGITGSLFGTASWANNTTSASYAATASYSNNFTVANQLIIDSTLTDYTTVASSIVGSNNLFTQATGSYTSAFFKYTATTGSNSRAGEVVAVWNGTTVQYYDNSTVDIGNTTAVTSSVSIVGGDVQFNMQTNTSGWRIKSLATFM